MIRMARSYVKDRAVEGKLAELRELSKKRVGVVKSMGGLKQSYGDLTRRMDKVKAEIPLLGGKVPVGSEYNERFMLWELIEPRRLSDETP